MKKPKKGILNLSIYVSNFLSLKKFVLNIDEYYWDQWTFRQKQGETHACTKAIKIKWIPLDVKKYDESKYEYHEFYSKVLNLIKETIDDLEESYDGKLYKILLTKLAPNSYIGYHHDSGFSLEKTHRIHLPIKTNPRVFFKCGETTVNMKEGYLYEINNQQQHAVNNESDEERIHMIIDIIPNENMR